MTYQALARKWRPQTFEEIIAQPHIVRTLKNALKSGKIHHAFLFAGPRGTGKTTTARILAKALNCETGPTPDPCGTCTACKSIANGSYMDVMEIDAASNTGVDDVRELRESSHYVATGGRYKVYIIDEVHRLSGSAFDALLKTLEEPPQHVVFIFATTESHKVPATIHSRCLKFEFRLIPYQPLTDTLRRIAETEQIEIDPEAIDIIAHKAGGSLRDGQSLLDQVAAYAVDKVTPEIANEALGLVDASLLFQLMEDFADNDVGAAMSRVSQISAEGRDFGEFGAQLVEHIRNLLLVKALGAKTDLLDVPADRREAYTQQAERYALGDLYRLIDYLRDFMGRLRWSTQPLLDAQMLAARAAKMDSTVEIGSLLGKIDQLLAGGEIDTSPAPGLFNGPAKRQPAPPEPPKAATSPRPTSQATPATTPKPSTTPKPAVPEPRSQPAEKPQPSSTSEAGQPVTEVLRQRILERIKEHSPIIAGFMTNSQISRGEAGVVNVVVYGGNGYVQKQLGSKSNLNMIQSEVKAEMGERLHVRLRVESGPAPDQAQPAKQVKKSQDSNALLQNDEKLRMIVETFDAEIMPADGGK